MQNAANEAVIIAQAGQRRAITIATNMAGRGTDIILGGNPEGLATLVLQHHILGLDKTNPYLQNMVGVGGGEETCACKEVCSHLWGWACGFSVRV